MWATMNFPDAEVRCVGFAGPRVGNKAFCQSANYLIGSSIRVEVGHDPIPSVPGRSMCAPLPARPVESLPTVNRR